MSMVMRELLPLQRIVRAVCEALNLDPKIRSILKSEVWEDNSGALTFTRVEPPRMTQRSKHYSIKYHRFREQVRTSQPPISLSKIDTKDQLADILTKGLIRVTFRKPRLALMG